MKHLIISPLVTKEVAEKFKDKAYFCATAEDVENFAKSDRSEEGWKPPSDIDQIYAYPFLRLGSHMWSRDINTYGWVLSILKKNKIMRIVEEERWGQTYQRVENLHLIMDGGHHAEMFEAVRRFEHCGKEKEHCIKHRTDTIEDFITNIIEGGPITGNDYYEALTNKYHPNHKKIMEQEKEDRKNNVEFYYKISEKAMKEDCTDSKAYEKEKRALDDARLADPLYDDFHLNNPAWTERVSQIRASENIVDRIF
jgi:hypothetical protein